MINDVLWFPILYLSFKQSDNANMCCSALNTISIKDKEYHLLTFSYYFLSISDMGLTLERMDEMQIWVFLAEQAEAINLLDQL